MQGRLFTQDGKPLYAISAHLVRTHHSDHGMSGVLIGQVRPKGDSNAEPYLVFGRWVASPDGSGEFKARIFESNDGATDHHRVGGIRGAFKDPQDDEPGVFHGEWKICP